MNKYILLMLIRSDGQYNIEMTPENKTNYAIINTPYGSSAIPKSYIEGLQKKVKKGDGGPIIDIYKHNDDKDLTMIISVARPLPGQTPKVRIDIWKNN